MKYATAEKRAKCPLYHSVQQWVAPSSICDSAPAPQASAKGSLLSWQLQDPGFQLHLYESAEALPAVWDTLLEEGQVFLSRAYLMAFEAAMPRGVSPIYLVLKEKGKPAGVMMYQLVDFVVGQQVQSLGQAPAGSGWRERLWHRLLKAVLRPASFRLLIGGAAQATGEYAYSMPGYARAAACRLYQESTSLLCRHLYLSGRKAAAIMAKDFHAGDEEAAAHFRAEGFHPFYFEPEMLLPIDRGWASFDDYLGAMTSKYRVRARRAFKKAEGLFRHELSLEAIEREEPVLHGLYEKIAEGADFSMIRLPEGYFSALKAAFGAGFKVIGYYTAEGELAGFCTALKNGAVTEAHFLGMEERYNSSHQLYLNMLYDMVRIGIEDWGSREVNFARTATEIKSSVGAVAVERPVYVRARNPLLNRMLPYIIRQVSQRQAYRIRHPFSKQTQ
ncbi:GNAT family protein [Phaeodactylibacter luteus]|uniref:GNAT family N-acetyltransferase n=1 Tax=Phaeodactylibacter luteus TaxID=1564516 RepID=A0A5C6RM95_9BACT|nr:hypothetical protein [Phaeodactylibacter luteus]TXB63347.1 hypothetical protein FRY97_09240 [Phaeodactylibacter luteus]